MKGVRSIQIAVGKAHRLPAAARRSSLLAEPLALTVHLAAALLRVSLTLGLTATIGVAQSEVTGVASQRQHYPLTCRGGGKLLFDTIGPPSGAGTALLLSLAFTASPTAAGPEGQGLQPSTCAWVDRPVNDREPRQVRVSVHITDSTPRVTVHDTGVYWSFLAHNSDSGHFTALGYRHWQASSPPSGHASATSVGRGNWLPFRPSHLHWYVLGWVVIVGAPLLALVGLWSGWRRLAELYPDRNNGRGRSLRARPMLMGLTNYRGGARLMADDSHLHFSTAVLLRPGHRSFSVPWSDIAATRDTWPWFPFKDHPVIRLTLAGDRSVRILVPLLDGERIIGASGGRLELNEPRITNPTATSARR